MKIEELQNRLNRIVRIEHPYDNASVRVEDTNDYPTIAVIVVNYNDGIIIDVADFLERNGYRCVDHYTTGNEFHIHIQ